MVELQIQGGEVEYLAYEDFEERVLAGRIPPDAMIRFAPVTGDRFVRADALDLVDSLLNAERVAWRDRFLHSGPPLLTALLVGIQIRIWCAAQVPGMGDWLSSQGMNWLPPGLEDGQMWRIPTSGLLHTDFLHILLNMVWMAYTGWNLERALGRANVAAIFFFSVFLGGILSFFLSPANPSLGASGGVYGLVAASVVFGFVRQDILPEKGRALFGAALAPYLLLMFFSGLSDARTDNWAHFGGIVAGAILAFVLDPPGYERGLRNRYVQIGGTAVIVAMLTILGVFGPHLHPLKTPEAARLDAMPRTARARVLPTDLLTDLDYVVPAGWKPGADAIGQSAFSSPVADRSFSVSVFEDNTLLTLDRLEERWRGSLDRLDATVEIEEMMWQGRPGRHLRATLDSGKIIDLVGTTRGMFGIQRVNVTPAGDRIRLQPLLDRLDASIVWYEPIGLQAARREVNALPRSVSARQELAEELALWGESEEATRIQRALVDEAPADPERWRSLFRIVGSYGDDAQIQELAERALAPPDVLPEMVVAVAKMFRDRGHASVADGLLQLAWNRNPGDRDLKRAMRRAYLPFQLIGTEPQQVSWTKRDLDTLKTVPLTVEEAERFADQVDDARIALARQFDPAADDAVQQLLTMRDGGSTPYHKTHKLLRRHLAQLEGGNAPRWMPGELEQRLPADVIERLRTELAP